jgi:hypothetical protein
MYPRPSVFFTSVVEMKATASSSNNMILLTILSDAGASCLNKLLLLLLLTNITLLVCIRSFSQAQGFF